MKRSQLKSPLGSPALQQTVRAKQKKGPGGEGTASGSGEMYLRDNVKCVNPFA